MENIPVSGRSVAQPGLNADAVTHSISYEETFLPQGSPFEYQGRMNSWKPEIPSNVDNPKVSNTEVSLLAICALVTCINQGGYPGISSYWSLSIDTPCSHSGDWDAEPW